MMFADFQQFVNAFLMVHGTNVNGTRYHDLGTLACGYAENRDRP